MISPFFAFWAMCYRNKWVTLKQLQAARDKGIITAEEYSDITV